jgi:hypothetical protein
LQWSVEQDIDFCRCYDFIVRLVCSFRPHDQYCLVFKDCRSVLVVGGVIDVFVSPLKFGKGTDVFSSLNAGFRTQEFSDCSAVIFHDSVFLSLLGVKNYSDCHEFNRNSEQAKISLPQRGQHCASLQTLWEKSQKLRPTSRRHAIDAACRLSPWRFFGLGGVFCPDCFQNNFFFSLTEKKIILEVVRATATEKIRLDEDSLRPPVELKFDRKT